MLEVFGLGKMRLTLPSGVFEGTLKEIRDDIMLAPARIREKWEIKILDENPDPYFWMNFRNSEIKIPDEGLQEVAAAEVKRSQLVAEIRAMDEEIYRAFAGDQVAWERLASRICREGFRKDIRKQRGEDESS